MVRKAFTLVELLTVMGVLTILVSLSVPQLMRLRDRNSLQSEMTKIISLMRQQQINAMNSSQQYGMYFEQTRYIQFAGSHFISTDAASIITTLNLPILISQINVPNSSIVFASGSGELVGYNASKHSITLADPTPLEQHTIQFNLLGVPISN